MPLSISGVDVEGGVGVGSDVLIPLVLVLERLLEELRREDVGEIIAAVAAAGEEEQRRLEPVERRQLALQLGHQKNVRHGISKGGVFVVEGHGRREKCKGPKSQSAVQTTTRTTPRHRGRAVLTARRGIERAASEMHRLFDSRRR